MILGDVRERILDDPGKAPECLPPRGVVVLCNLEPRKMMGTVSQGMVLDAGYLDGVGKPPFLTVSHRVPNGVRVA